MLFWPGVRVAGLYHTSGKLFMAYALQTRPPRTEMRWSADNAATFSEPVAQPATGGVSWPPWAFEMASGNLLVLAHDGDLQGPVARLIAVRFNVASSLFDSPVVIEEGRIVCRNAARLGNGRVFVSTSEMDASSNLEPPKLRFSDDEGLTWSPPFRIPVLTPIDVCPQLAASKDELYLMWGREDNVLSFSRAGGPGVCQ